MAMTIGQFGNGTGYVYLTLPDGVTITANMENTSNVWQQLQDFLQSVGSLTVSTDTVDATFGYRVFGNTAGAAGSLAGATELTNLLVGRDLHNSAPKAAVTIATGVIAPPRSGWMCTLVVDTEGAAASDDLDTITIAGVVDNDTVTIVGANAARIVTVKNGTGNITLANAQSFNTGAASAMITLKYLSGAWYEQVRSNILPTVANQRLSSIAIPVQGANSADMLTNGTVTYVPGTDKGYQIITGSPVLIGGIVFQTGGTPMDGDTFTADYRATPTLGANTVTIFGITLTTTQAQQKCVVTTTYRTTGATWYSTLYVNGNGIDFATTTQVNTRQASLPASGGVSYILSTTTAGTATPAWIPNPNNWIVTTVTLSAAQIKTLNSAPTELIPAPGANLGLELIDVVAFNDYGGAAFAAGAQTLDIGYTVGSQAWRFTNAFLQAGADATSNGLKGSDLSITTNTHIVASTNAADPTLGTGSIILYIIYRTIAQP